MKQTIVDAVLTHGKETPDQFAVAFKETTFTYRELCRAIRGMAALLRDQYQISEGDFVMISAVSRPEYVVGWLAIQYLRAVSIPIDKSAKVKNILEVYRNVKPKLVLMDGKILKDVPVTSLKEMCAEAIETGATEAPEHEIPSEKSLSEILFTTGTTGKPKGGMLSNENILASTLATINGVEMESSDCILIPLPLHHSFGMRVLRASLYIGATVILQNGFTFAKELEKNLRIYNCSGFVSAPASLEMIYRQMQDKFSDIMGKLRYIEISSGSLSPGMKQKMLSLLPNTDIINSWGSTETGGAIFLNVSKHPDKIESIGTPIEGVDFLAVDNDGNAINARNIDTAGRMVLKGPMAMMGYYNMPEATAETLVNGWLYTNDLVYKDDDGFIYMLGRADDIINVGGEKVSPVEVENVASEFDGIKECACIGVDDPDELLGRVPILYIVPEKNAISEIELGRYLTERLEKYKLPHQYIQINELPRNQMNKIDRRALLKMWEKNKDENLMNDCIRNILSRRSIRDFTNEDISKNKLDMILQCGYYAPSGHNMQTWKFTVIQDKVKIIEFKELVKQVAEEEKVYFYGLNNPNVLILVSNDRRNRDAVQDSSCAAENIMLAANSYGIGSVWINVLCTICDIPEIREMLNSYGIPEGHTVWATIAMGYPMSQGKLLAKKTNVVNWL